MTAEPGTYRVADGSRVKFGDALAGWVPLAHEILIATARRYHGVVTYAELGDGVQERSGIRTRVLLPNWIGKLLEAVAILAKTNDEPPLTSLAVHQDGTIGTGYASAPKSITDSPGDDIEYYAAEHRLLCYRRYEAVGLPGDGGEPALTKAVSERRARKAPAPLARPSACPVCNMVLLPSGACGTCA